MAQTPLLDADFFKYGNTMPYVFEKDTNGTKVSPSLAYSKNAGGLFVPVSAADPMPVTTGAGAVTTATLQNGVGATGNGAAMPVAGLATVSFTVSGTFVATVVFEGTTVATNPQPADWFSINAHQSGTTTVGTTATTPGIYRASVAGLVSVRAKVSAWTSGTVTATGTAVAVEDTSKVTAATLMGNTLPSSQALPAYLTNVEGVAATTAPAKALQIGGRDISNNFRPLYTSDGDSVSPVNYLGVVTSAVNGNGTSDRWRNNIEGPLHTSTARTTGTPSPDQTLYNGAGVDIIIDVTAIGPAPSVTFTIEVRDPTSGKYVAVLASPAIIAIGTYRMVVYPGIAAVANKAANDRVRRTWRLTPVHTNIDTITYSTSKCDLV